LDVLSFGGALDSIQTRFRTFQVWPKDFTACVQQVEGAVDRWRRGGRRSPMSGMRRREFITVLGGAAVWPLVARAQAERVYRVGLLMGVVENSPGGQKQAGAVRKGLEDLGWTDGRNIRL